MNKTCLTCIWRTDGFNDGTEANFCMSEGDYIDQEGYCDFWKAYPERILVQKVAELDKQVDD